MTIEIDPETERRIMPPVLHVFTTTRMFGPDIAHHVVPIMESDFDRTRLFERRIGKDLGRNYDRTNDVIHTSQTKSDFDRYHYDDGVPVPTIEHESFDAYLKAIGYSWSRNSYRAADTPGPRRAIRPEGPPAAADTNKHDVPELSKARADAMQALDDLAIGEIFSSTDMSEWGKKPCSFVIERSDGQTMTDRQKGLARNALEDHGFRIVTNSFKLGRTILRTFQSVRTVGMVDRHAQRGTKTLIVLQGSDRPFEIDITDVEGADHLLRTRKGDEVVLWEDVLDDSTPKISAFVNRSMS